jgi:hypothetical protein
MILRDINILQGTAGRTTLRPDPLAPLTAMPSIVMDTTLPGNHELSYPPRQTLRGLIIAGHHGPGSQGQIGLQVVGAHILLDDVTVAGFGQGLALPFSVNVAIRDSLFTRCGAGVVLGGLRYTTAGGTANVTHTHFTGCRFAHCDLAGVIVFHGYRVGFHQCIFENNTGKGLLVTRNPADSPIADIIARDDWFELNVGGHIEDGGIVRREGVTGAYGA